MPPNADVVARNKAIVQVYYPGAALGDLSDFAELLHTDFVMC
jgi:ketosteroid isomerase-like protein